MLLPYLSVLSKFRDEVRRHGRGNTELMQLCDRLRDEDLVELGVAVDDQPGKLVERSVCYLMLRRSLQTGMRL